jgi:hypothetical protein
MWSKLIPSIRRRAITSPRDALLIARYRGTPVSQSEKWKYSSRIEAKAADGAAGELRHGLRHG